MNSIYIEHNPFTIKTTFLINDEKPDEQIFLNNYVNRRIQLWIEGFFKKVGDELFNGTNFKVIFKGLENDAVDVKTDIEKTNSNIKFEWIKVADSDNRLNDIKHLIHKAEKHPLFSEQMKQPKTQENLEKALSNDFDIYVAATMSAGKSTFLNSLLGSELLPAANEATTAIIAEITDNKELDKGVFKGRRIDKAGNCVEKSDEVTLNILKDWNSTELHKDTAIIKLEGNVLGINARENIRLILTDTPGPNNSQDKDHEIVTFRKIQDNTKKPLICYLLNATQIGINDDKQTLTMIAETMKQGGVQNKDRFLFLLNKADSFDEEKGESIQSILEKCKDYIKSFGIADPLIFPISARNASLLRKRQFNFTLSRAEMSDLRNWEFRALDDKEDNYIGIDFTKYMPLSTPVKQKLQNEENIALLHTGIPAIEAVIDNYIDKYSIPERVFRAYDALKNVTNIARNKEDLIKNLESYQEQREKIKDALQCLKDAKKIRESTKKDLDKLIDQAEKDPNKLSLAKPLNKINELEAQIREMIELEGETFKSDKNRSKYKTDNGINEVIKQISNKFEHQKAELISKSENLILNAQDKTQEALIEIYKEYLETFFSNINIPKVPRANLKKAMSNIGYNFGLEKLQSAKKITQTEEVRVGERSRFVLWNPFTWWADPEYIYEEIEIFDADATWNEVISPMLDNEFNQFFNLVVNKIRTDIREQINTFSKFISEEFAKQMTNISQDMEAKMRDDKNLKEAIQEAEKNLEKIKAFEKEIDDVIAL
ncbi:dynamin family protein [Avibacterium sp. 20-126]|uniref:dynamin family protein n=1 Tax=Avibacterium sp. 20-126 TaxID=2911524 RepID=UPI002186A640|nr:dynamin family protein [Avibacterium sp. 20-126]